MALPPSPGATASIHLLTDFDCTITTCDTISSLAQIRDGSPRICPPDTVPPNFCFFTSAYLSDLKRTALQRENLLNEAIDILSPLERELRYINSTIHIERASIERLEQHKYFSRLSEPQLFQHGRDVVVRDAGQDINSGRTVGIRKGWWELVHRLYGTYLKHDEKSEVKNKENKSLTIYPTIDILSVNWSTAFILGILDASHDLFLPPDPSIQSQKENILYHVIQVHCNNLLLSPTSKLTTGQFTRFDLKTNTGIWTSSHKSYLMNLLSQDRNIYKIYVGDSISDFECLLQADVGIIMGENEQLGKSCGRTGIEVVDGLLGARIKAENRNIAENKKKTLYRIRDWTELLCWFDKLEDGNTNSNDNDIKDAYCIKEQY